MKRFIFFFIELFSFTLALGQQLQPAAIFQNGMVLQREKNIHIWGTDKIGKEVKAQLLKEESSFSSSSQTAKSVRYDSLVAQANCFADSSGHFSLYFSPLKAGGPYILVISDNEETFTYKDVWIGEVWLCSGQSNMELRVSETNTKEEDISIANSLHQVHFYNMESLWPVYADVWNESRADSVDQGLFIRQAHWKRCSKETAKNFSAIGFTFARILSDSLSCHIGIISNAVGGSTTEGWIDSLSLQRDIPEIMRGQWTENNNIMEWARRRAKLNLKKVGIQHSHPYAPAFLYKAATSPIAGFTLRGFLWYQGESNAELINMHERLFPLLEKSWRTAWQCDTLPFFTVQLSSISTRPTWPAFRNSQRILAQKLPYTYLTVCSDVGDSLNVHPVRKRIVATRLANQALHHIYGYRNIVPSGPEPLQAIKNEEEESISILFSYGEGLCSLTMLQPSWFEIQASDGKWYEAQRATIESNKVIVASPYVKEPIAVRYAWKPFTRASLINSAQMPCSTFKIKIEESTTMQ